ncbi:MAG: hypothetical protein ACLUKQ_03575 [Peptococcaceae bacterium]
MQISITSAAGCVSKLAEIWWNIVKTIAQKGVIGGNDKKMYGICSAAMSECRNQKPGKMLSVL